MNYCNFYKHFKQRVTFFILLSLLVQPLCAQSYEEARDFLSVLIDGVVDEVKVNNAVYREDADKLYSLIDQHILSAVDIELFSKLVLGSHWNSASTTQRQSFASALRDTMVRSYGKSLLLLSAVEKIDYPISKTNTQARYQIVKTTLFFVDGKTPIFINYAMLAKEDKWVIFDLIVDGLSIGKQFRQNFDLEIKETSLDALIARLQGDVTQLKDN